MTWTVEFCDDFEDEFDALDEIVSDKMLAMLGVLEKFGPTLGRPKVDTLYNSKHTNMKELRFSVGNQEWRIAFAFDPDQKGILLVGGNKTGKKDKNFYKDLIRVADKRYSAHLKDLEG
ncbi:MAG: type II toxin-antitoxin system RelE/ParE family toxin [Rhodospirillales bacterium]|nr:type II toxin-antitoxin system RelE/ParE family toxin [Rhodospirillales bacterium]